jgi:alkanesulfonate monooxygenase SsuD/methylene tetrahydromethanopterin reductase-like flavin-dependent oxidoreductase (luciferase family)
MCRSSRELCSSCSGWAERCAGSVRKFAELARPAEAAGFDAVHVTDHPFPPADWVADGGHHSLDPFVTLAHVASVTESLRLHTHLVVGAYRNPFLLAKAAATLDVLSTGGLSWELDPAI